MAQRMFQHPLLADLLGGRSSTSAAIRLQVESTLTDRYQTTVPETVRRVLRLGKRDKIHYTTRVGVRSWFESSQCLICCPT